MINLILFLSDYLPNTWYVPSISFSPQSQEGDLKIYIFQWRNCGREIYVSCPKDPSSGVKNLHWAVGCQSPSLLSTSLSSTEMFPQVYCFKVVQNTPRNPSVQGIHLHRLSGPQGKKIEICSVGLRPESGRLPSWLLGDLIHTGLVREESRTLHLGQVGSSYSSP